MAKYTVLMLRPELEWPTESCHGWDKTVQLWHDTEDEAEAIEASVTSNPLCEVIACYEGHLWCLCNT